jgi:hypothetical protein
MHHFSNLFWHRTLHVLDTFTVHHQETSTVHTAIDICHTGYAVYLIILLNLSVPMLLIPVGDPLSGNGRGSPNHI